MSRLGRRGVPRAVAWCLIVAVACSDSEEAASSRSRSDGSPAHVEDGGRAGDAGRGGAAGSAKDASLDSPAPPPFGFASRPGNATCVAPKRPTSPISVSLVRPFPSLPVVPQPLGLLQAPNDPSRWFIFLQRGVVYAVENRPDVTTLSTFITIQARVNWDPDEAGLLGMAFDPNFATNGVVYLSYTAHGGAIDLTSRVSRFVSRDGGKTLDPNSEEILLSLEQPFLNHNGGNIQFGRDGLLYIGFGDGGSAGDPNGNGQNRDVLLGKMLRIAVSPTGPYTIPKTNPFAAGGGAPEIYAYGFRNPWRWSFDFDSGDLWVGDVGQGAREEIDRVKRGGNYGWKLHEGKLCTVQPCPTGNSIDPIVDYGRTDGVAVIGGYVYRGTSIPELTGTYLYADYVMGTIWALLYDPLTRLPKPAVIVTAPGRISSFGQGVDGEIYVVEYVTGDILKLVPRVGEAGAASPNPMPSALSATGCVDKDDPTKLSAGVIPYDVNVPYWSDGVELKRGFAIPDGTKIKILADGRFEFPNGTVLVQTASKDGRRLDTRLLVRYDDGDWDAYAYEWNQAQTDASLIRGAKLVSDGSFSSYVPQPIECFACHRSVLGRVLGFQSRQINRDYSYSNGARLNQIAQFEHIGLFDSALPASAKVDPFPPVDGSESVDVRARAYLEVNCAMCHRPDGADAGVPDLRIQTPVSAANLCNVAPKHGGFGIAGATLLAPGSPELSVLSLRMHADDWARMPPPESQLVDAEGAALIDEWIKALAGCGAARTDGGG